MKRMAASSVARNGSSRVSLEDTIHDLVPANLAKARGEPVPVISAKYTKVGESIRRNAPQQVRYDRFLVQ